MARQHRPQLSASLHDSSPLLRTLHATAVAAAARWPRLPPPQAYCHTADWPGSRDRAAAPALACTFGTSIAWGWPLALLRAAAPAQYSPRCLPGGISSQTRPTFAARTAGWPFRLHGAAASPARRLAPAMSSSGPCLRCWDLRCGRLRTGAESRASAKFPARPSQAGYLVDEVMIWPTAANAGSTARLLQSGEGGMLGHTLTGRPSRGSTVAMFRTMFQVIAYANVRACANAVRVTPAAAAAGADCRSRSLAADCSTR